MEMRKSKFTERCSRLLMLVALFFVGLTARAADVTWVDMELDTPYQCESYKSFYGRFTPEKSGILSATYHWGSSAPKPYLDAAMTQEIDYTWSYAISGYEIQVEAGTTYYFAESFFMQGGEFTISMANSEALEVKEISPAAGATLDLGAGAIVDFVFDKSVKIGGGTITSGSNSAKLPYSVDGAVVTAEMRTIIYEWLSTGKINAGDVITVTLTNVRATTDESIKYGTDGTFSVDYICPVLPVHLVSSTGVETFLSYWMPGNTAGIRVMTFSGDLNPTSAVVTFGYGNPEASNPAEYYTESIPYTVNGNVLTIDFTGVVRDPKAMIASGTTYSQALLSITNVRSADGQYVYTENQGSLGSYSEYVNFKMVSGTYSAIFRPETGSDLTEVNNITLMIYGNSQLSYSGLQVAYTDAEGRHTEALTAGSDYSSMTNVATDDDIYYSIPVKAAWRSASDVVVSLSDFVSVDGVAKGIEAKYNAFVVTGVKPVAGATVGRLVAGDSVLFTTNRNAQIAQLTYEIHDLNPETEDAYIMKSFSYLNYNAATDQFRGDIYATYKFMTGHNYSFVFKAYAEAGSIALQEPIGVDSVVIAGGTAPYTYSDTKFVSISPASGSVITSADQNVFEVVFDGLVSLSSATSYINVGQGVTVAFDQIYSKDGNSVDNTWYLVVPTSYLENHPGALNLTVVATDLSGYRVEGNEGEDEGTYFNFQYTNKIGVPTISLVSPAEGTVTSLSTFVVSCADGIYPNWQGQITLNHKANGQVAYVTDVEQVGDDDVPTQFTLKLNKTITDAGSYRLDIPEGFFILGEDGQYNSEAVTFNFTIEDQASETTNEITLVTPENGAQVESLYQFKLHCDAGIAPSWNGTATLNHILNGEVAVVKDCEMLWESDDAEVSYEVLVTLDKEITDDGRYFLSFPAGYFVMGAYGEEYSEALTFGFLIDNNGGVVNGNEVNVVADPADGSTVDVLSTFTVTFPDEQFVGSGVGLGSKLYVTDETGAKVSGATLSFELDTPENQMIVTITDPISVDGEYTVNFAAGTFVFGENGDRESGAFTLTYKVGTGVSSEHVVADPADGSTVSSLSKIYVTFTDTNECGIDNYNHDITVTDAEGKVVTTAAFEIDYNAEMNVLVIALDQEITADGVYTVNVPALMVIMGSNYDQYSKGFKLTYTIGTPNGIEGINADKEGVYTVYNLQGVQILRSTDANALRNLNAGVYIINGKTQVIR
jgi:hypothetical protein